MNFPPVATFDDLDGLDYDQIVEGYMSAQRGDPEPGQNRGRSYWHGWRCRMMDYGEISIDACHQNLVKEYLEHQRRASAAPDTAPDQG
jgi:hypothetical protein